MASWCDLPIMQAPIGSAASPQLCAAVSNAGGLGGLALTWRAPHTVESLLDTVRQLTDRVFYGNFVLHFEPKSLGTALDAGIPMITFSWGNPCKYVSDVRSAGCLLGIQVTSATSAKMMLDLEPDFLIVQGNEAGGHVQAHWPLDAALHEVLSAAGSIPVYAAGGLATGQDLARVMRLGAAGGVFGTRFVATTESEAHPQYRERLVRCKAADTVLTNCFEGDWPFAQHRVLRNSTFTKWEAAGCPPIGQRPGEADVLGVTASGSEVFRYDDAMPRHDLTGDWEAMCLYAGMGVEQIKSVESADVVIRRIWGEAQA